MRTSFLSVIALMAACFVNAQSKSEALTTDTLTWFGLDFSKARFIDEQAFKSGKSIKEIHFADWNRTILAEPQKYELSKFFKVKYVKTELGEVYTRHELVDPDNIILDLHGMDYSFNEDSVKNVIAQYEGGFEGYGVVFIIENFCKINKKASMWVTFFHIPSKQVVFAKRMIGEPGGIGLNHYWLGGVFDVFEKTMKEKSRWLKE